MEIIPAMTRMDGTVLTITGINQVLADGLVTDVLSVEEGVIMVDPSDLVDLLVADQEDEDVEIAGKVEQSFRRLTFHLTSRK